MEKNQEFLCESCKYIYQKKDSTLICKKDFYLLDDNQEYNDMVYECNDYKKSNNILYPSLKEFKKGIIKLKLSYIDDFCIHCINSDYDNESKCLQNQCGKYREILIKLSRMRGVD